MNMVTESMSLFSASITLCLWMWFYNDMYPIFYKTPDASSNGFLTLPNGGPYKYYYNYVVDTYKCDVATVFPNCSL